MNWIEVLKFLSAPIMGAVIGLFTNWLAVKMLFIPRRAIHIGKWHLPFTPGVIPRRQGALAKALGETISESLVRKEDLKETLCSDAVSHTIARSVLSLPSVHSLGEKVLGDRYGEKKDKVLDLATDKILEGILAIDIGEVISREATDAVASYAAANPLIKMFVSDQLIATVTAPIAGKVTDFLQADGREKLRDALAHQVSAVENKPVCELVTNEEKFETVLVGLYRNLVQEYADAVVDHFHIEKIVEDKIRAMDPKDLETLVLSVMKKELNSIVYLGLPIGFIMGLFTTLMNYI